MLHPHTRRKGQQVTRQSSALFQEKPRATKCCCLRCEVWNMSGVKNIPWGKQSVFKTTVFYLFKTHKLCIWENIRNWESVDNGEILKSSHLEFSLFSNQKSLSSCLKYLIKHKTIFQSLSLDKHSCFLVEGMRFKHISEHLLVALPAA